MMGEEIIQLWALGQCGVRKKTDSGQMLLVDCRENKFLKVMLLQNKQMKVLEVVFKYLLGQQSAWSLMPFMDTLCSDGEAL